MFFASNWFYTYQYNGVNLARFNLRTRALNNILYWIAQIVGATVFGFALDYAGLRRTARAIIAWAVLLLLTFGVWGGGYKFQTTYDRADRPEDSEDQSKMDWTSSGYVGPMFLYIFYGFYDAAWQTCVYWSASIFCALLRSSRTNDSQVYGSHDKQRPQACKLRRVLQVSNTITVFQARCLMKFPEAYNPLERPSCGALTVSRWST